MNLFVLSSSTATITCVSCSKENKQTISSDISEIFKKKDLGYDTADAIWLDDVSTNANPVMDQQNCWTDQPPFSGAGYRSNLVVNSYYTKTTLLQFLNEQIKKNHIYEPYPKLTSKDIDVNYIKPIDSNKKNVWVGIEISGNSKTANYFGSFMFYYYVADSATKAKARAVKTERSLKQDFSNNDISYETTKILNKKKSIGEKTLLEAIKSLNPNVDIESIKIQFNDQSNNWVDWADDDSINTFGVHGNNPKLFQKLWNQDQQCYAGLRLTPITNNIVYNEQEPINFTLKLYRPNINDIIVEKGFVYQTNFKIVPDHQNIETMLREYFAGTKLLEMSRAYPEGVNFQIETHNKNKTQTLSMSINDKLPYYSSNADPPTYKIMWWSNQTNEIDFCEKYIKPNMFDGLFYQKPEVDEVIGIITSLNKSEKIYWKEINVSITNDTIRFTNNQSEQSHYSKLDKQLIYKLITK